MTISLCQLSTPTSSSSLSAKLLRFLHCSSQPLEELSDNVSLISEESFHLLSISSSISTSPCSSAELNELEIFNKFKTEGIFLDNTPAVPLQSHFLENVAIELTPFEKPVSFTDLENLHLPSYQSLNFVPPVPLELPVSRNSDHSFVSEKENIQNVNFSFRTLLSKFKDVINKSIYHTYTPISLKVPLMDTTNTFDSNQENFTLAESYGGNRPQRIKFNKTADMLIYSMTKHTSTPTTSPSPISPYDYSHDICSAELQKSPRLSRSSSLTRKLSINLRRNRSCNNFRALEKPNSILKSKVNQNFNSEVSKISEIDNINLSDFLNNFRNDEISKLHQEHLLTEYRLNQLKNYYDNEHMTQNNIYNTYG